MKKVKAYCFRCKNQVKMQKPKQIKNKQGRPSVQGTCPDCNSTLFKLGKLA